MTKRWTLQIRFLVETEEAPDAWSAVYDRLPETDDVLISYDSMVPAEEYHTSGESTNEN